MRPDQTRAEGRYKHIKEQMKEADQTHDVKGLKTPNTSQYIYVYACDLDLPCNR
jgi:hypothetical protein